MTTESPRPSASPRAPHSEQPRKRRSPVERIIVWGLIVLLVVFGALEWRARAGYDKTLESLEARNLGKLSELEESFHMWPVQTRKTIHQRDLVELKWFSLMKDYRIALMVSSLDVDDPLVTTFQTAGEAYGILAKEGTPEPEIPDSNQATPGNPTVGGPGGPGGPGGGAGGPGGPGSGAGGPGGPGGPGGGGPMPPAGGGGMLKFADLDLNKDGHLGTNEVAGPLRGSFDTFDKNGDQGIDEDEYEAYVEASAAERARRTTPGGQTPMIDAPAGDAPAEASADAPAGEAPAGDAPADAPAADSPPGETEAPAEGDSP